MYELEKEEVQNLRLGDVLWPSRRAIRGIRKNNHIRIVSVIMDDGERKNYRFGTNVSRVSFRF